MDTDARLTQLLECLIHVIGRVAIPVEKVKEIVATSSKQVRAFNLCDGTKSQGEVARAVGVNQGNLSRSFAKWIQEGVALWVGEGTDAKLLHIYPIPAEVSRKAGKKPKAKRK